MMFCNRAFGAAVVVVGVNALIQQTKIHTQRVHDVSLPNVSDVLANPKNVLSRMSSSIEQLKRNMADIQIRNAEEVLAEKKQYERKMYQQKQEIIAFQNNINRVQTTVADLRAKNAHARQHAEFMRQQSQELLNDAHAMQENFTSAWEVVNGMLEEAQVNMTASPELAVLNEAGKADAELELVNRLDAIGRIKSLALLQFGDPRTPGKSSEDAKDLVHSLISSLGSLSAEQNASSKTLKVMFEREYATGERTLETLRETLAKLNATQVYEEELWQRLHAADEHASNVYEQLKAQALGIRRFAKQLGYRQVLGAPQPSKAMNTPAQPALEETPPAAENTPEQPTLEESAAPAAAENTPAQPALEETTPAQPAVGEKTPPVAAEDTPAQPAGEENAMPAVAPEVQPALEENTPAQPAVEENTLAAEDTPAQPAVEENGTPTVAENTPAQPTVEESGTPAVVEKTPAQLVEEDNTRLAAPDTVGRNLLAKAIVHEEMLDQKKSRHDKHRRNHKHDKHQKHTDKEESSKADKKTKHHKDKGK